MAMAIRRARGLFRRSLPLPRLPGHPRLLSTEAIRWMEIGLDHLPERVKMAGVDGATGPKEVCRVMEREPTRLLKAAMEMAEQETVEHGDPTEFWTDDDWTCTHCGYNNHASKSRRMFCGSCSAIRTPLPRRSAYLLTGPRGAGKSIVMAQLVHWARQQGWVALVIPAGWILANRSPMILPSEHSPSRFEDPFEAKAVLELFKKAHGPILKQVPVVKKSAQRRWNDAANLQDLLDAAIHEKQLDDASTALNDVVDALADCTTVPCLVAVDEIESLFAPHINHYYDHKKLRPDQLIGLKRLRSGLMSFAELEALHFDEPPRDDDDDDDDDDEEDEVEAEGEEDEDDDDDDDDDEDDDRPSPLVMKRGIVLYATSMSRPNTLRDKHFRQVIPHMPYEVPVAPYNDAEFQAAIAYFRDALVFDSDLLTGQTIKGLMMMTQRNPQKLFQRLLML